MAVPATNAHTQQAPQTEPKSAPKNEPNKPADNTAAKQSPQAAKSAVNNAFGEVPKSGDAKQPDSNPKLAVPPPKDDTATPPAADSKSAPSTDGSPAPDTGKAPSGIPDTTGKQVADPQPSPAGGNAKPAPGDPVTNAQGQPVKTPDGWDVVKDRHINNVAIDPNTGKAHQDPSGHPYAIADSGNYIQSEDGKYGAYDKHGNLIATDPKSGAVANHPSGNAYSLGVDGKYRETANGDNIVVTETGKIAALGDMGKIVADKDGNPYKIQPDGKFAMAEDGSNIAYGSKEVGYKPVSIDPKTGTAVADANGNPLALDDSGKFLKTSEGKTVVYDKSNKGNLSFVDPATGKIATDGSGNPYTVAPNGDYAQTEDGNYVVYDKANGNNPIAIDNKTGQAITDGKGHPLALDEYGKYLKTPEGNTVVYVKLNGKFGKVATDKNGDPLIASGKPAAVGADGKFLQTEKGESVVYDTKGNAVAIDKDGKVVTDDKGNPLALGENGATIPGAAYDKYTGFKIHEGVSYNVDKMISAFDEDGNQIQNKDAIDAFYDSRGTPVFETRMKTPDGYRIYQDAKTGELEVTIPNGPVYKIDPATNDFAKDANGNFLPALYDPVNSDPTRPPVTMNEDPGMTVAKLPQGTERGDPAKIKDELFDDDLNLSVEKLYKALETYDPRDVYGALIQSGDGVTYDVDGDIFQPDATQAKQIIAAYIAWHNENGKYSPIKNGKVPSIGVDQLMLIDVAYPKDPGTAIVDPKASAPLTSTTFQALNNLSMSGVFKKNINKADAVTEYLANNWTGKNDDTRFDESFLSDFKLIDAAIMKMGNGDRDAGLDKLKRAYFGGDPLAINELKMHLGST